MSSLLSIEQLRQLEGIMRTMLAEANDANWQELSRLDSERRVLIGYKERAGSTGTTPPDKTSERASSTSDSSTTSDSETREHFRATSHSESTSVGTASSFKQAPDPEYLALSGELTALDKEINRTVLNARQALLEQTRVLKAQVSAKKRYEQANTMKISSYS